MKVAALLLSAAFLLLAMPGAAKADDPPGVSTRDLVWAQPIDFPPDTMMIVETGCSHCDAPATGVYRIYRGSGPDVRVERIPIPATVTWLNGVVFSPDGIFGATSECIAVCEYNTLGALQNEYRFFSSDDGGMTWRDVGTRGDVGPLSGATRGGPVVASSFLLQRLTHIDGSPIAEAERPQLQGSVSPAGYHWDRATKTLFDGAGDVAALLPFADDASLFEQDGYRTLITSFRGGGNMPFEELITREEDGIQNGIRTTAWGALTVWLNDQYVIGYFDNPNGFIGLSETVGLLDLDEATLYPVGWPFGEAPFLGRNRVIAAARGPFLRVLGPDCLALRAWPNPFASEVACAAPGVLLRPGGGVRYEQGVEWSDVTLPNGSYGWVPRNAVEE